MSIPATAKENPLPAEERIPISDIDRKEIEQLYEAIRQGRAKLVGPNGEAQLLPDSLYAFLIQLIQLLNQGKSVYIVQYQAKLTTIEAAAMLGVSRQFLVNLLKKGEIPHHMVGTHRRIYAKDLFQYKSKRDEHQRQIIGDLSKSESDAGLYDKIPATYED